MWIYLPESCRSVQEGEGSISGSDSLYQKLELSATWKTKSRPAASWRRIWPKAGWTTRLFGQTYDALAVEHGVAKWIGSLGDTHASHSATLADALAPLTHGTSGLMLSASSQKYSLSGASLRTSALILDSDSMKSPETYKAWATALRRFCLQRKKSARLTGASGYSYSLDKGGANAGMGEPSIPLTQSTASGTSVRGAKTGMTSRNWQTPNAAAEAPNLGSNIKNGPKSLMAQAVQTVGWATPTSRDGKDGAEPSLLTPTNSLLGRQAPRTMRDGLRSSLPVGWASSRLRLNPRFVTWLMGWPTGWAYLTSSTFSGTE